MIKNGTYRRTANFVVAVPLTLALLFVVTCVRKETPAPTKPSPNVTRPLQRATLRLLWFPQSQFAGFYVANARGFYREAGLDVDIRPGGPDIDAIKLVASDSEQFGITAASQVIQARSKGIPLVALAIIYQKNPTCFFAKKSSRITKPKDWIGRTVGVKYGLELEYYYRAILKNQNIPAKKVKAVPIQFDMARFFTGDVDVWCGYRINEPNIAEEQGIPVSIIDPDDYGVTVSGDTIFTTEKMLREHPDVVRNFVHASLRGWQEAIRDQPGAVAAVRSVDSKLGLDHEKRMLASAVGLIDVPEIGGRIGWMTPQRWETIGTFLREYDLVKEQPDVRSAFTNEYVDSFYSSAAGRGFVKAAAH